MIGQLEDLKLVGQRKSIPAIILKIEFFAAAF
jgi:hypothetical protein